MGRRYVGWEGEIDGSIVGLNTDDSTFDIIRNYKEKLSGKSIDYLVGFGIGIKKGQGIRSALKDNETPLSFEKKLSLANQAIDLEKRNMFFPIWQYQENFLLNQSNWGLSLLEEKTVRHVMQLCATGKDQRALRLGQDSFLATWQLASFFKVYELSTRLKTARRQKALSPSKIKRYQQERIAIREEYLSWLQNIDLL